VIEIYTT